MHPLEKRDHGEAPGGGAVPPPLHRVPGEDRARTAGRGSAVEDLAAGNAAGKPAAFVFVAGITPSSNLSRRKLIDITPGPTLSRLDRPDERMRRTMKMFRGVLVLRGITASHVPTAQA